MKIAVVDYGAGNLRSAAKAFAHVGGTTATVEVTSEPERVRCADRIVLPGQGAFGDCAAGLRAIPGMVEALDEAVHRRAVPLLGICVGMQLFASHGFEHGTHAGLDWIAGEVRRMTPADAALKLPQLGWNGLVCKPHKLVEGWPADPHVYFANSFCFVPRDAGCVVATADYGGPIAALVAKDNIAGSQFHPEKSQAIGLHLIANFLQWQP
jgi:imidazole glycerol-phosphate synthase subunit HisH